MSIITPKRKNRALGEDNLLVTFKPCGFIEIYLSLVECYSLPSPPHQKKNKTVKNSEEKLDFRL